MATKPTVKPKWADSDSAIIATPSTTKQDEGWGYSGGNPEKPPLQWFNWLGRWTYRWIKWLDDSTAGNKLAGDFVQYHQDSKLPAVDGSLLTNIPHGNLLGNGSNTHAQIDIKLARVVYVDDYGAIGNGTTDDTAAIQAALDQAGRVVFTKGKTYLTSGNQVSSNTHIVFEKGAKLKLANSANRPALQNTNWQKTGWGANTYGIDTNITIEGLYLDGNQANQAHTGTGTYAGEYTSGIRFFGVTGLVLKDITIYQARTFGIWCCAVSKLTAVNVEFQQYMGGIPDNQDGLHINGPAISLNISNIRGSTNDDMIALNADDGALGSNVTNGAITDAIIDGVNCVDCLNGIRILSASSRIDRIIVRSITGSTRDVALNVSPFGLGSGNVGDIFADGIDLQCSNGYAGTNYYAIIGLDGTIENIRLRNITRNKPTDNRPIVYFTSSADVKVCEIEGVQVYEAVSAPTSATIITCAGNIDTLSVRGIGWYRDAALARSGKVLLINAAAGKGVSKLICSDWIVTRIVDAISLSSGILGLVQLNDIVDNDGDTTGALINLSSSTGATTNLSVFNCRVPAGKQIVKKGASSAYGTSVSIDSAGLSGASAGLTANQTVSGGVYTLAALNTVLFDRMGEYSTTNKSFTVTQAPGVYLISYSLQVSIPTSPTDITLAIYKNGVAYRYLSGSQRYFSDAVIGGQVTISVSTGDVLTFYVYSSQQITLNASASTVVFYERLK